MENEELLSIIKGLQEELKGLKEKKQKPKKKYKPRAKKKEPEQIVLPPKKGGGIKFRGNTFNDNEGLCEEDKDFDNKVKKKSRPVPRTRPAAVQQIVKCTRCFKDFPSFSVQSSYFICPKCAKV